MKTPKLLALLAMGLAVTAAGLPETARADDGKSTTEVREDINKKGDKVERKTKKKVRKAKAKTNEKGEKAEDKTKEGVRKTGDKIEDAGDKAKDKAHDATH